jgi:hypothetical protein
MSENGSPVEWWNFGSGTEWHESEKWPTGDTYRPGDVTAGRWELDGFDGWIRIDDISTSYRWLQPVSNNPGRFPSKQICDAETRRLRLQTLPARFEVETQVRVRQEHHDYTH